jgi:FHA domain-containing protein
MSMSFRVVSLNEENLSIPLIGRFDERGGEIGRSDNVTFTLPDPERMISRVQAKVVFRDGAYWIENVSAANPILHNGRPLSSGMTVALKGGDEVRVGGYRMLVDFESDETSVTILRGRTRPVKEYADKPAAAADAPPPAVQEPEPSPLPAISRYEPVAPPVAPPRAPVAPRFDPAAGPRGAVANAPAAKAPAAPVPAAPAAPVPAAPLAATGEGVSADALWQGFLEGAGVTLPLPHGPSPELFSAIGAMMKIAVEGIHRLVSMRAVVKSEMQAELTMIQVKGNNPLKFAPDPAVALQLLLQPPARGFMAGPSALRDALIDLQSHQIGVMTGMRAALGAVLDRFDPVHLETKLSARSVFDSLVPAHRRSRLWELYLEHFRALREEAHDDFNRLFGEAFRQAYEEQVRILEEAAEPAPSAVVPAKGKPR